MIVESGAPGASDPTRLLIDCGLGLKEIGRRLEARGLQYSDLSAIFVTHEHADHIQGVARFARAADVSVFLSHGTRIACPESFWRGVQCIEIDTNAPITIGTLTLAPYPVPHDAREPTQVVITDGYHRLGVLTDAGKSTPHIEKMLSLTDALFLEANHDETLLENSAYPESLKSRIAGPFGHLSNTASAGILQAIDQSRLQIVVAAHLSRHNNTPELVTAALAPALASSAALNVASQIQGFDWIRLG